MGMKKWFKSTVAILALTAMLLENGYSVFATDMSTYAEDTQTVLEEVMEEISEESTEADLSEDDNMLTQVYEDSDSESDDVISESEETDIDIAEDGTAELSLSDNSDADASEDEGFVVADYEREESVTSYDNKIVFEGYEDMTLYINTDQMNSVDSFSMQMDSNADMSYDFELDDTMSKSSGNIYYIQNINKAPVTIYVDEMSEGMEVQYSVREDGYPQITLVSAPDEEAEKILEVSFNGKCIEGSGYDDITITFDNSYIQEDSFYSLRVETAAKATYGGKEIDGAITSLSADTDQITVSDLNEEDFTISITGENVDTLSADYLIDSIENGAIRIVLYNSDDENAEKRLTATSTGIRGIGFNDINISMDYIKQLVKEAAEPEESSDEEATPESEEAEQAADNNDEFEYSLVINTDAEFVTVNSTEVEENVILDNSVENIKITGLDGEEFTLFVEFEEGFGAEASYEVTDIENGEAAIGIDYSLEASKTVYEYEDENLYVKATLQYADAIPDNAVFNVSRVETTQEYIDQINEEVGLEKYSSKDLFLYDIGFYTDDTLSEEIEPANGSVKMKMKFKSKEIADEIDTEEPENIDIFHFTEEGIEEIEAEKTLETDAIEFIAEELKKKFSENK